MKKITLVSIYLVFIIACKDEQNPKAETYPAHTQWLFSMVQKNPDSVGLRLQLVYALDSLGFYNTALQQMDSLITKDSLNYGLWFNKAQIQQSAKDTVNAIVSYKRAARIYPSPEALLGLANLFAETKNDTALLICKQLENFYVDRKYTADCRFIEAIFYSRTGNFTKANDLFDACINARYTYVEAYLEKGFILYDAKQFSEALKIFTLATEVSNAYADAYYWQAKCYEALNDKANAITNYNKTLALDKNFTEAETALKRLQ